MFAIQSNDTNIRTTLWTCGIGSDTVDWLSMIKTLQYEIGKKTRQLRVSVGEKITCIHIHRFHEWNFMKWKDFVDSLGLDDVITLTKMCSYSTSTRLKNTRMITHHRVSWQSTSESTMYLKSPQRKLGNPTSHCMRNVCRTNWWQLKAGDESNGRILPWIWRLKLD